MSDNDEPGQSVESGLIIRFPALDQFVAQWRRQLHPHLPSIPAHITVMYPFVDADQIPAALGKLEKLAATIRAFPVTWDEVAWFDTTVVYLAPSDETPFRSLTRTVTATWPSLLPYGGEHPDPTPHLTLSSDASRGDLEAVANAANALLPHTERATGFTIVAGDRATNHWTVTHEIPFRG